jgi:hypothetical protein
VNLIVPIWSSARSGHREEFGNMTKPQEDGLLKLIGEGRGIAGWHGHMGDAFRDRPTYHFLIGGQFVAHPPGWPDNLQPAEDYIDYDVTVTRPADPIMEGIRSFPPALRAILHARRSLQRGAGDDDLLGRSPVVDRGHRDPRGLEAPMGQGASVLLFDRA